jgi:hypothetical protein
MKIFRKSIAFLSLLLFFLSAQEAVCQVSYGNAPSFYINSETQSVSASSSSSSITFTTPQAIAAPTVLVTNAGSNTAFLACGNNSATAQLPGTGNTGALPILAGETMTLGKTPGMAVCAAITSSSTTTIYFSSGKGQ